MGKHIIRRKTKMIGVMLTERERAQLMDLATDAEMSMSEYVRSLIKQADRDRKTIQLTPTKTRQAEYSH